MIYYRVEVECCRVREWTAYIEETRYTLEATSRKDLEVAVRNHLESALGEKYYQVIWIG